MKWITYNISVLKNHKYSTTVFEQIYKIDNINFCIKV